MTSSEPGPLPLPVFPLALVVHSRQTIPAADRVARSKKARRARVQQRVEHSATCSLSPLIEEIRSREESGYKVATLECLRSRAHGPPTTDSRTRRQGRGNRRGEQRLQWQQPVHHRSPLSSPDLLTEDGSGSICSAFRGSASSSLGILLFGGRQSRSQDAPGPGTRTGAAATA